ncbi:MAG: cobalamin B12-binding domain-containing protein [Candidatus Thorarchaeota archaeon]
MNSSQDSKKQMILGASLGNCVHVAGPLNFLALAEARGYRTEFLGPATSIEQLLQRIMETDPDIVGLSYRLTPKVGVQLVTELSLRVEEENLEKRTWIFGGTTPVVTAVKKIHFFDAYFDSDSTDEDVLTFLAANCDPVLYSKQRKRERAQLYASTLIERLAQRKPWPLIRHHFGLPDLEETIVGVKQIAEAKCLDVISIGPDQNAQQFFFRPDEMQPSVEGAGGVPIRNEKDLRDLFAASRYGNFPLMRCYSGTQDLSKWAKLLQKTINNAWCATPINWYSALDRRSTRTISQAIRENMKNIAWHGRNGIPVEVNEPHHWSLRQAHDTIAVAAAYWSAFIAKSLGVGNYIIQMMMNTPLGTSPSMDLAKMWAYLALVESLEDETFRTHRQVRTGLLSLPVDMDAARGQLASSMYTAMMLNPDIVHVVGFCEADHAATSQDVIQSCRIVRQVVKECLLGVPNPLLDPIIVKRRDQLVSETTLLLKLLMELPEDRSIHPLLNPETYFRALKLGILDAPDLVGNPNAQGQLKTRMINGACYAVDEKGRILKEETRLAKCVPHLVKAVVSNGKRKPKWRVNNELEVKL